MKPARSRFALALLASLASCATARTGSVPDSPPLANAWVTVALQVTGPNGDDDAWEDCVKEAHASGINIDPAARIAVTVYLSDDGNRMDLPTGSRSLGNWSNRSVCRVALAYALGIDQRVVVGKQEPSGCQAVGPVQGDDQGYAFFAVNPGSYEAALAALQLSAFRRGANYVVMDLARQVGLNFSISGRAFRCEQGVPPSQGPASAPQYPSTPPPGPGATPL